MSVCPVRSQSFILMRRKLDSEMVARLTKSCMEARVAVHTSLVQKLSYRALCCRA